MKKEMWTPTPPTHKFDQPKEPVFTWPWKVFIGIVFVIGSWLWVEMIIHIIL